jgi:hypothetical protein
MFFALGAWALSAPPGCLPLFLAAGVLAVPGLFAPSKKLRLVAVLLVSIAIGGGVQQWLAGKSLKAQLELLRQ